MQYTGSTYHKDHPSEWGPGELASDRTPCPPDVDPAVARETLATAIAQALQLGDHSVACDGVVPRYAWGISNFQTDQGHQRRVVWEARVVVPGQLSFKAYPVTATDHSAHMPSHVRSKLWPPN